MTTRAGDPLVHDHVLIANVVWMRDDRGGWKGRYTAFVRDQLWAATAVGRLASARKAVELGCGIEADDGRSGRLGSIAGIPDGALTVHSTRSAEIDAAVGPTPPTGTATRRPDGTGRPSPMSRSTSWWPGGGLS